MFSGIRNVLIVLSLLLVSSAAQASAPLRQFLESAAGRFILGETSIGSRLSARILGRETGLLERHDFVSKALEQGTYRATALELEHRLSRLEASIYWQADRANSPFRVSAHSLTSAERETIERVLSQYIDDSFIEFVPVARSPFSSVAYDTARRAFLSVKSNSKTRAIDSLKKLVVDEPYSLSAYLFRSYETLRQANPEIERALSRGQVYKFLVDEEMPGLADRLQNLLSALESDPTGRSMKNKVNSALRKMLHDKAPASSIEARLNALRSGKPDGLRQALGELSLEEANQLLHGGNPLAPTRGSLIGKYLAETGAATVIRDFPIGPGALSGPRPERLVVAVNERTFPVYLKYFANENLLVHLHGPRQGHLYIAFNGKAGDLGNLSHEIRLPGNGAILPHIVLKTTEGQRATQYFCLAATESKIAQWPWTLPNYCATGGYNSCTHWFGNIPIGDKLVKQYKFPGMIDNYASNRYPPTPDPRVQDLFPYEHPNPLVKKVWKTPGNEQLADVLGLQAQNLAGEFANPGFMAHALTGPAPVERVPVVFLVVSDHRAAIPRNFDLQIYAF